MKIKICGLNPIRDVQLCIDLKVNYLGFVFYEKSPRNISLPDIKILSNYDRKNSIFVAVTVNPSDDFINKNLIGNFDYIQLHGSETKGRITEIQNMGFKIIKAIKAKDAQDIDKHKEKLNKEYGRQMKEVEDLIIPLLNNLAKSSTNEYIYWPNRREILEKQIEKITAHTRDVNIFTE